MKSRSCWNAQVHLNDPWVNLMVGRHTSIWIINQILDLLSEQTIPESGFSVAQLIERGNVRHALKEVSSFATWLLSQIPLQGIELYLGFWSSRFLLSWWFVGAVCWPPLNRLSVVSRRERLVKDSCSFNPKTSSATEHNVGIHLVVPFLLPSVCWEL
jgi:hypothetical protein